MYSLVKLWLDNLYPKDKIDNFFLILFICFSAFKAKFSTFHLIFLEIRISTEHEHIYIVLLFILLVIFKFFGYKARSLSSLAYTVVEVCSIWRKNYSLYVEDGKLIFSFSNNTTKENRFKLRTAFKVKV